jgi:hypothetical protein
MPSTFVAGHMLVSAECGNGAMATSRLPECEVEYRGRSVQGVQVRHQLLGVVSLAHGLQVKE